MAGVNPEHLDRLPTDLAPGWTPDLARLESLKAVRQMSPRDYRESWAWVHYLLNDTRPHKAALLAYLGDLRTSPTPRPLSDRLGPGEASPLLAHLARLRERPIAATRPPATRPSASRAPRASRSRPPRPPASQSRRRPGPDSPAAERRSFLGRMFGWLGS